MRQSLIAESLLDTFHHQIPDHFSGDAAGAGAPGHDFSVAGIECEGDSNDLPAPTSDLEAIRGPAIARQSTWQGVLPHVIFVTQCLLKEVTAWRPVAAGRLP
jgi:hypothetical protein